ncbi:MAG: hypothetical protein HQ515_14300 [Phycisphaeraceae bacterium]|nr:hypothetical protein [Phycisphaeraceae bacterium]
MRLAAFDLETAKILPPNVTDLKQHMPLGISCAAIALSDAEEPEVWSGSPQLTADECGQLVDRLQALVAAGYTLVTWNGASFDFFVLAQESGRTEDCGQLALDHADLMVMVTFNKGYFLGLDKALAGAGLQGKVKSVALRDGTLLSGMSGAQAPALWKAGEHEAVIAYLKGDVAQLLALAEVVERTRVIRWLSNRGKPQSAQVKTLLTVSECFQIPEPDTSWMSNAPTRSSFVDWIPGWVNKVG